MTERQGNLIIGLIAIVISVMLLLGVIIIQQNGTEIPVGTKTPTETVQPTEQPTEQPTIEPTVEPTVEPTPTAEVGLAPPLEYYTFFEPNPTYLIDFSVELEENYDILKSEVVVIAVPNQNEIGVWQLGIIKGVKPVGIKIESEMTYFCFEFVTSEAEVELKVMYEGNKVLFINTYFTLN